MSAALCGAMSSIPCGRLTSDVIARLYDDGMTIRQIAAKDGRSRTTIHRILRHASVSCRPRGGRSRRILPEQRADILAAYLSDGRMADICAAFRVSSQSVRNIATEAGIALRARGGRRHLDLDVVENLAEQGWTPPAVALLTGYSERHIRREMRALGYGREDIDPRDAAEAYGQLGSVRAVAREFGCSPSRARTAIERGGVAIPARPRRVLAVAG